MNNFLVSVITVSFNAEKLIERTIQSVIAQDYKDIEYIVVDGNSTDGTKQIVEKYLSNISKFISEPDSGIYDAMNKGLRLATGDIIYFLNADDYFFDNSIIQKVVEQFLDYPNIAVLHGMTIAINPPYPVKPKTPFLRNVISVMTVGIHQQAIFSKKSVFDAVGNFDTSYQIAGDLDWFLRVYKGGLKIKPVEMVFAYYDYWGKSTRLEATRKKERERAVLSHVNGIERLMYRVVRMRNKIRNRLFNKS